MTFWTSRRVSLIYSSLYCLAWAASPISNLFSGRSVTSSIESGEAFLRRVSEGSSYSTSSISFVCLCRRVFKLWLVLLKIEECESDLFDLLELVGLEALLVCGRLFSTGWVVLLWYLVLAGLNGVLYLLRLGAVRFRRPTLGLV